MATPNRPLSAREFFALPTSGIPFIPELHTDDCDNVDCVRCVDQPQIARLDVPAELVSAEAILRESLARHAAYGNEDEVVADADAIFLLRHPELCSTESGNPEWDAWLAQRIEDHTAAWNAAHNGGQA